MKNPKILLILLIIVLAIMIWLNKKSTIEDNLIMVDIKGKIAKISYERLDAYKHYKISDNKDKEYSAVKIIDLLSDKYKGKISNIEIISQDGMKISLKEDEIKNSYLIKIEKNDKKYYRLAIPNDQYKQRWLKYVSKIVVK